MLSFIQTIARKGTLRVSIWVFLFFTFVSPLCMADISVQLSSQKLIVGVPMLSYSRVTVEKTDEEVLPYGVAIDDTFFITSKLGVSGQYVQNMNAAATVYRGGAAGITWYLAGGTDPEIESIYVNGRVSSRFQFYVTVGITSRSYDFTHLLGDISQQNQDNSGVIVTDDKDVTKGSFNAPQFGVGLELPVIFKLYGGARMQLFNSIESPTRPTISGVEAWFYVSAQI